MDISENLFSWFQEQYRAEAGNYLMYQSLANTAGNDAYDGFEKFFQREALDEITHSQKIFDFLIRRNRAPVVAGLPDPQMDGLKTPLDWVQHAYEKAKNYTSIILEVYKQADTENDSEAQIFLQWFITEQARVENEHFDLVRRLTLAGDDYAGIKLIDADVGEA